MTVAIVTGAAGLIGSEAVHMFADKGLDVVGIDNDMRRLFFGEGASTAWNADRLTQDIPGYIHYATDIRDEAAIEALFAKYGRDIGTVVHCAAQPSHDWAASDPFTDFSVNATGTLVLLEATRKYAPEAAFIFMSTNKVYGDLVNSYPLVETETRWELAEDHVFFEHGIDESMSVDGSMHSLFGVSKAAADLMVQEYGRYFGLNTSCFRGGCLTGPAHSGAELHGFLAYLIQCAVDGTPYRVFGYKGKQVRDNIHSNDLVNALWYVFQKPRVAAVYNIGGGRRANCSMLEAIRMSEELCGHEMNWSYEETSRSGDHLWWISDTRRLEADYPEWRCHYDLKSMMREIYEAQRERNPGVTGTG